MARVLKTGLKSRLDDAACWISKGLLAALDPLHQNVAVGRATRAPPEQLGEIMGTHVGERSELRQAEIFGQIVSDVVQHPLETISR